MMVFQFELKIMPENDPSSIMPSRALMDLLPVALPRVHTKHSRLDQLLYSCCQSAAYAPQSPVLPNIAIDVRPIYRVLV